MNHQTMYIGPKLKDCVGVGPMKCMQVRDTPDGKWSLFYSNIAGFDYEEGFDYEIKVEVSDVENPPADASSKTYTLVEVVSKEAHTPEPFVRPDLYTRNWQLVSYQLNGETQQVPEDAVVSLSVNEEDGRASGRSACNNYTSTVSTDGAEISFALGVQTLMACPDENLMQLERTYLDLLTKVRKVSLNRSAFLDLMGEDGEMLRFRPVEE